MDTELDVPPFSDVSRDTMELFLDRGVDPPCLDTGVLVRVALLTLPLPLILPLTLAITLVVTLKEADLGRCFIGVSPVAGAEGGGERRCCELVACELRSSTETEESVSLPLLEELDDW